MNSEKCKIITLDIIRSIQPLADLFNLKMILALLWQLLIIVICNKYVTEIYYNILNDIIIY